MTPAELEAYAELAEVAAQWKALADWERGQASEIGRVMARNDARARRPGLIGGRGPRPCRLVPMPARTDWRRTIPGMPIPRASVQTDEEPFPLVRVWHLPPPPSTPRLLPANDPQSLFSRALAWTLKLPR